MAVGRRCSWRTICLVIMVPFISMVGLSDQSDTIFPVKPIRSDQRITSKGGIFELVFFSPGDSGKFYVGIRYKSIPRVTYVWIANRETPIVPSRIGENVRNHAYLILTSEGDLQIRHKSKIIWNSSTATTVPNTTKAVLHDSGNLIVGSDSSPNMWESFNNPTDTWLPGANIGCDITTGKTKLIILNSWRKEDDPSSGNYSLRINPSGSSEFEIYNKTDTWSVGASDFSNINLKSMWDIHFNVSGTNGVNYATYSRTSNSSIPVRMTLTFDGQLHLLMWMERNAKWLLYWSQPHDVCKSSAFCGKYGICSINESPPCNCPQGFVRANPSDWNMSDFSEGCVRSKDLECHRDKDSFITLVNINLPQQPQIYPFASVEDCRFKCSANCNCSAYRYTGDCSLWFGDLSGMSQLSNTSGGENLYLRVGSTEFPVQGAEKGLRIILPLSISLPILVLSFLSCYFYRKNLKKAAEDTGEDLLSFDLEMTKKRSTGQAQSDSSLKRGNEDLELPMFSLASVSSATDYFAITNKLGEGGFGPVYKGKLRNGQEVAVKRLSKHSSQGLEELINEAKLIAKLQHTNLVRLLGCCIQQDEKILIYEYMPNKSLDFFLFDQTKKEMLDWSVRMQIIEGIAQGLLYLHHYSRLKIIHRDLKANNILLDVDMTPKISDFGLARIFGKNELQANTRHIVGTFGYMPPEYALEGLFSVKTDVFSFGILFLEILSGERNTSFRHEDCYNLLGYAWKLWRNDTPFELIDPIMKASCNPSTAFRYVHVGLLCVQEDPDDRPSMLDVVAMIANEMKAIEVQPKQPANLVRRRALEENSESSSLNALTFSTMQPR